MSETRPLRFGILGCGSASLPVSEAILASPLTELTAVYDVNQDLANDLSREFDVPAAKTLAELLANSAVDAVYIAVPHDLLAPLTEQTLEAGKHALTEKPLGISVDEIDRLIAKSTDRGLALGVFYEMRYAPAHALARQMIQAGAIGEIVGIQLQTLIDKPMTYWQSGYSGRSLNPWRGLKSQAGGGVILMNTSHLLDALLYMTDLTVTRVSAEIGTLVANVEVEDIAAAALRFDNGAIGSLMAGAHVRGAHQDEYCSIYGTEGQICLPDPYGTNPMRIYLRQVWDTFAAEQWHSISLEPVPVYRRALEEFAQAVRTKGCVPVSAQDARQVLSIVLAIYRSASERRTIAIT